MRCAQLPTPVRALSAARTDSASRECRTSLLALSAEPNAPLNRLLEVSSRLSGSTVSVDALREAVDRGLVTLLGRTLQFRHPLMRSAIYTRAAVANRVATHRALAAVMDDTSERQLIHLAASTLGPGEELAARLQRFADASQARGKVAAAVRPCARRPSSSTTRATGPASWSGPPRSSRPVWATGAAARVAAPPWKANRVWTCGGLGLTAGEVARWVAQRRPRSGRPRSVRAERDHCAARVTPAPLGVRGWFWWGGRRRSITRIRRCRCPDNYGCVGGPAGRQRRTAQAERNHCHRCTVCPVITSKQLCEPGMYGGDLSSVPGRAYGGAAQCRTRTQRAGPTSSPDPRPG